MAVTPGLAGPGRTPALQQGLDGFASQKYTFTQAYHDVQVCRSLAKCRPGGRIQMGLLARTNYSRMHAIMCLVCRSLTRLHACRSVQMGLLGRDTYSRMHTMMCFFAVA